MIGTLDLIAVDECLAKESEFVVDAVAEAGHVHRGERIEEARGESSESAVAEGRVVFERLQFFDVDAELRDDGARIVVHTEINEVVPEGAAHQELHGEIVETLRVLLAITTFADAHRIECRTAHRDGERLQSFAMRCIAPKFSAREAEKRIESFAKMRRGELFDSSEVALHDSGLRCQVSGLRYACSTPET